MKDGSILLWEGHGDLVSKAIMYFTNSPYTHVAVYVGGWTFDSTIWNGGKWWQLWKWRSGIRKTWGTLGGASRVRVPKKPLTQMDAGRLLIMADAMESYHFPYNIPKLLILALVYPTRWFWEKINWVPFQADVFGEVCSEFVDEVFKSAGMDLFPNKTEQDTVPGDFANCSALEDT
jgi:hypothetical protein